MKVPRGNVVYRIKNHVTPFQLVMSKEQQQYTFEASANEIIKKGYIMTFGAKEPSSLVRTNWRRGDGGYDK
jgi:hypothetical protein